MTGRCIPSASNPRLNVCEVSAWCPVERDVLPLYNKIDSFTLIEITIVTSFFLFLGGMKGLFLKK